MAATRREIVAVASFGRLLPSSATQSARAWASTSPRASPRSSSQRAKALRSEPYARRLASESPPCSRNVDRRGGAHGFGFALGLE